MVRELAGASTPTEKVSTWMVLGVGFAHQFASKGGPTVVEYIEL